MQGVLLRAAVFGYVLLIWLAVWPFPSVPILGAAAQGAERILEAATLRSGLAVFPGAAFPETQVAPHISCTRVVGLREGRWEVLFDPECPPTGAIFRDDPFERTLRSMLQIGLRPLVEQPIRVAAQAPIARRIVELGDYFCHVRPGIERVVIRRRQHLRNYRTGVRLPPPNQFVCVQICGSDPFIPPECSLREISLSEDSAS